MKRLVLAFGLFCLLPSADGASPQRSPRTLRDVAALTNAQASRHQQVSFEATVTYFRNYERDLFVQDGDKAI